MTDQRWRQWERRVAAAPDERAIVLALEAIADELEAHVGSWESLGVRITRRPLIGRRGGIVHRSGSRVLLVDESLSSAEAEFVLAHELAHLFLSFSRVSVPREEQICDLFAERLVGARPATLAPNRL